MTMSDDEWERRILCSDGNCIGVIGADGRCKMCGKLYEGDLPLPAADSEEIASEPASGTEEADASQTGQSIDPVIGAALERVNDFVEQVTGTPPTPAEIADALGRYFVLNEIKEHIVMVRENKE